MLKTIFAQDTKAEAQAQWDAVTDALREKTPKLGAMMDASRDDVLAYMDLAPGTLAEPAQLFFLRPEPIAADQVPVMSQVITTDSLRGPRLLCWVINTFGAEVW